MGHVLQVADQAGEASRNILTEASEIGSESETPRREVEAFLQAVNTDSGERRRFERIAGSGVTAMLRLPGAAATKVVVDGLSETGVGLRLGDAMPLGREAEVELPGAGGPVTGRVNSSGAWRGRDHTRPGQPGLGGPLRRPRRSLTQLRPYQSALRASGSLRHAWSCPLP